MASYPSSAKSFTTKSAGDTIQGAHVNDLQDEVTALETALLTGGLAHAVFPSTNDGFALGSASKSWSDLFLANGGVINFNNGNLTLTHAAGILKSDGHLSVASGKYIYLDGGGDTALVETSADILVMVVGGTGSFYATPTYCYVPATNKLYFDGGSDTYIVEGSANQLQVYAGATETFRCTTSAVYLYVDSALSATKKFYLDGGGNTYLVESSADNIAGYCGGSLSWYCSSSAFILPATNRLYLDGGGDSYIVEGSADAVSIVVGGTTMLQLVEANPTYYLAATGGYLMVTWPTTASAANAQVADTDVVRRSTSSRRYKKDIEALPLAQAKAAIQGLRAITYRGKGPTDFDKSLPGFIQKDHDRKYPGFIAEEVHDVDPLLVTYDKQDRPDYVTYDRITAMLVPVVQDLERRLAALEAV